MTVDPTDPETFEDTDQDTDAAELSVEAPEADAAEQQADVTPHRDTEPPQGDRDNADEADRAEQARVVEIDEDDYR